MKSFTRSARGIAVAGLAAALALGGCCAAATSEAAGAALTTVSASTDTSDSVSSLPDVSDAFTERDQDGTWDESEAIHITLSDAGSTASGDGVSIDSSTITITAEGTYVVSGTLSEGQLVVDVDDSSKIQIVLDGASITSASSAALYIKSADKVFVTLASGSTNTLATTGEYVAIDENNIDAVLFSKEDLVINGEGSLNVTSAAGHGIVSKDDLKICGGALSVEATKQALSANDSIRILDGTLALTSGGDTIHSEGYVGVWGATLTLSSGDDGIHADELCGIAGGTITIVESYEGLEGLEVLILDGDIEIHSTDDGINAAGGSDSGTEDASAQEELGLEGKGPGAGEADSFGGMPAGASGGMDEITEGAELIIAGGTVCIYVENGDGIDSNNTLTVTGGTLYVYGPENDGNSALDYAGEATISGGTLVAVGMSGMAQGFGSNSTQGAALINLSSIVTGGLSLKDASGSTILSFSTDKSFNSVVVSCADMEENGTYTLEVEGESIEFTLDGYTYTASGTMTGAGQMGAMGDMGTAPSDMGPMGSMEQDGSAQEVMPYNSAGESQMEGMMNGKQS